MPACVTALASRRGRVEHYLELRADLDSLFGLRDDDADV